MREIIYETKKAKIYKDGDSYELFALSARNLDGYYDISTTYVATYSDVYMRDWLGRTSTWPQYNRNNEKGYGYKAVMEAVKYYE